METVNHDGMPRPHYLQEAEVTELDGEIGYKLKGVVLFPSDDVTIGDRVDHVNVAHTALACWNAAHVIAKEKAFHLRACGSVVINPAKEMKPDVPVNIEATARVERRIHDVCYGSFTATFCDNNNQVLSTLCTQFVCKMVE